MKEVKFTNRENQKDSLVLECSTVGGGGILIALGNDKFSDDWSNWDIDDDQETYLTEIDSQVWNCFEFTEYEDINKPSELIGKSISVHNGNITFPEDEITNIDAIYKVKDYFPYDELTKEEV